ncbi:MAG TPA: cytochrome c oxidase subunit II [Streptosporangiaceae bacterium]|nr:cytochrome c oxidase subunit II [Streptosporangiaceae bacterium]
MAASAAEPRGSAEPTGRNHGLWIFAIWLPLAVIVDVLLYFVYGPHMPPGTMSDSAASQQFDIKVMSVLAAPVMVFVLVYAIYSFVVWRHREGDDEDGPAIYGHARIQATWITVTAVIVLFLAGFGSYELAWPGFAGAGAGEGPSPVWKPTDGTPIQVQVIGQQWRFTYRYPQFGGFETTALYIPVGVPVQFNVTSLDVIHDFWAYQLGVKADANPGVNNVAYTTAKHVGTFTVRCDELCGLWHGAMTNRGQVVSVADFQAWAQKTQTQLASITAMLPPYATTYDPTVVPQMSKAMVKAGLLGGNGYYYPPNDPSQP